MAYSAPSTFKGNTLSVPFFGVTPRELHQRKPTTSRLAINKHANKTSPTLVSRTNTVLGVENDQGNHLGNSKGKRRTHELCHRTHVHKNTEHLKASGKGSQGQSSAVIKAVCKGTIGHLAFPFPRRSHPEAAIQRQAPLERSTLRQA